MVLCGPAVSLECLHNQLSQQNKSSGSWRPTNRDL